MRAYLADLDYRPLSFTVPVSEMTPGHGWILDCVEDTIGTEPPGLPPDDGLFARARQSLINYDFSDPRIVVGHFDPEAPLVGRNMLLEIKVLGFRFLSGVRVHSFRDEVDQARTLFGFRYDALEGHIECGFEWFILSKDHRTGEITLQIEAHWRLGSFPNWWSRLGFLLIGSRCRELWRRRAIDRLRQLSHQPIATPATAPGKLAHRGEPEPRRSTA